MNDVGKVRIFNVKYFVGISILFLLFVGLIFRFKLFNICFDKFKGLFK